MTLELKDFKGNPKKDKYNPYAAGCTFCKVDTTTLSDGQLLFQFAFIPKKSYVNKKRLLNTTRNPINESLEILLIHENIHFNNYEYCSRVVRKTMDENNWTFNQYDTLIAIHNECAYKLDWQIDSVLWKSNKTYGQYTIENFRKVQIGLDSLKEYSYDP
jgi:hypothetical protein